MNEKGLKTAGIVLTIVGAGISVASALVGSKQQENLIDKKVNEAIANKLGK